MAKLFSAPRAAQAELFSAPFMLRLFPSAQADFLSTPVRVDGAKADSWQPMMAALFPVRSKDEVQSRVHLPEDVHLLQEEDKVRVYLVPCPRPAST